MSSSTAKLRLPTILAVLVVAIALTDCATSSNTRFQSVTQESAAKLQSGDTKQAWQVLEKLAAEQSNLTGGREAKRALLSDAIKVHIDLAKKIESQGDLGVARTILLRAVELECLDDQWSANGGPATASYKDLLKTKNEVSNERQAEKTKSLTEMSSNISVELSIARDEAKQGRFEAAQTRLSRLAPTLAEQFGTLSGSYLRVRHALGDLYKLQSRFDDALKIHREDLRSLEALSSRYEGSDKEHVWGEALNKEFLAVASLEECKGRYADEERTLLKAKKLCAHTFGKGTLHFADVEIALSSPLFLTGRGKEALIMLGDALTLYESRNSGNHSKIFDILAKQAVMLAREGRFDDALKSCDRALELQDRHPGAGSRGLVLGLSIQCLLRLGREEDAIRRTAEFISLCNKGSVNHVMSFEYLAGIGDLWTSRQNYSQARRVYEPGLRSFEALKPTKEQQRYALDCYLQLADSNYALKRLADTIASTNKATQLINVDWTRSVKLAGLYNAIAGMYGREQKFDAARSWQLKSLKLCETRVGLYEAPTISTMIQLSDTYRGAGNKEKANEVLNAAVARCAKKLSDPEVKKFKAIALDRLK